MIITQASSTSININGGFMEKMGGSPFCTAISKSTYTSYSKKKN